MHRGRIDGERVDDALHPHEARALDEQRRIGRRRARDVARQRLDRVEMRAGLAEGRRGLGGERARGQHPLDACRARVRADLAVVFRPAFADLAHVAQHQPARRRRRRQHVDGGAHRVRVGVVRVVDDRGAIRRAERRESPGDRTERLQSLRDGGERNADGERGCRRGQRVGGVVPPAHGEQDVDVAGRRRDFEADAVGIRRVASAHGGRPLHAELDDAHSLSLARGVAPRVDMRVVGVEHGDPVFRQRAHEVRVLGGDLGHRAHEFLMLALRIVDERDGRLRDRRQRGRLAAMIHAELDRRDAMRGAQPQQRHRQADRVVEIALRREHGGVAEMRAQDGREHFLHGRLAVAADDDDDRNRELPPPVRGQRAQRGLRISGDDEVAFDVVGTVGGDQRGDGAPLEGRRDEIVAVEALA